MNIFLLNVYMMDSPAPIRLIYKSEEAAKAAAHRPVGVDGQFILADDFGTELHLPFTPVARVLVDLVHQLDAEIELGLLQTRAQIKAQKRFQQDPTLSNNSSVWTPQGGNGPVVPFPGGR